MKKILIPILLLILVLIAPMPGYCYKNVIAIKTTSKVSEYDSTLRIGLSQGAGVSIAVGAMAVTGIGACLRIDYILNAQIITAKVAAAREAANTASKAADDAIRRASFAENIARFTEASSISAKTCVERDDRCKSLGYLSEDDSAAAASFKEYATGLALKAIANRDIANKAADDAAKAIDAKKVADDAVSELMKSYAPVSAHAPYYSYTTLFSGVILAIVVMAIIVCLLWSVS